MNDTPTPPNPMRFEPLYFVCGRKLKSTSTTDSSAIVETSPRSRSPTAILRSTRRMIFPDRVLGSAGASCMKSGWAKPPILWRTASKINSCSIKIIKWYRTGKLVEVWYHRGSNKIEINLPLFFSSTFSSSVNLKPCKTNNKYSLLMHCIKIKSPVKFLLNEQYVFVGGNISFLCVLSCSSEEA